MSAGSIMKEMRKSKGESRAKMAELLGISPSAIYQYEVDMKRPRDDLKVRIAEHFGSSVQDIFFTDVTHNE